MRESDGAAALALSTTAGWNQSPADWQRMLQIEPAGCFVAELNDEVVGTAVCCPFGIVAWLAMIIVAPALRGQGLGRRLAQAGLDYARICGIETIRLDATHLGHPVYTQLGFQPQCELIRMGGVSTPPSPHVSSHDFTILPADLTDSANSLMMEILRLDHQSNRSDREKLLRQLCNESPPWIAVSEEGKVMGYLARRQGRLSEQLGPCCGSHEAAISLLHHALETSQGKSVIVDIPTDRTKLIHVASKFGLTPQRTLLRMCRGPAVVEDPDFFQASYGGEFG
jgi:GNAT superfamily N-acetyltransferase